LDTSSLVKVYIDEAGSDEVRRLFEHTMTTTSVVAYAEARAALARLRRSGVLSSSAITAVKRQLDGDWSTIVTIVADDELCRAAGRLAEHYGLRGFDAIHLASYLEVVRRASPSPVVFSSFDERLARAAAAAVRTAGRPRRH
jgi:predicted nucleic acid-binding protein